MVYAGRKQPFKDVTELKCKIRSVWKKAQDINKIRAAIDQFLPRLREVVKQNGGAIQHIFG